MSNKEMFTEKQREELCTESQCKEHANGTIRCPIPLYKEDLNEALSKAQKNTKSLKEHAEPKKATGHVVRSNAE